MVLLRGPGQRERGGPWASRSLALVLGLAAMQAGCSETVPPRLSGVLITIDTTNPGALDVYQADRGVTPELARLAQQSVVHDRAHTVAPITLPAHISMMTGLYPLRHGVRDNGWARLSEEAVTLAERAHDEGFRTGAFVSAVVLGAPYGLDQGFDVYSAPEEGGSSLSSIGERSAAEVTEAALSWLEEVERDRPLFLWVHYFDPHMPYSPPERFLEQAGGNPYLAEVATMDHEIGRLVDVLDDRLGAEGYLLAVAADHGESFGRHGEPTHSAFAYQATVKVPLLVRYPDGRGAGTRSDLLVSVVDLYPTFLEELELGPVGEVDGLGLERGDAGRGVYVESYSGYLNYGWSPLAGWIQGDLKYLHSSDPELYDLAEDPEESLELLAAGRPSPEGHRQALGELEALPRLRSGALELDEARLAELRALGYAASGGAVRELPLPLEPSERPAPRSRAAQVEQFARAIGLAQAGRTTQAIAVLEAILGENPSNVFAAETLASCLFQEQRFDEVVALLEPLVPEDRYGTHSYLAASLENLGRLEPALVHYRAAQRLRPTEPTLAEAIQRVERRLGR